MWVVGLLVILLFGLTMNPLVSDQRKTADRIQAIANMRSLSCAFLEFDQEFGSYPDDETAPIVADATGSELILTGPHSNPYFRQLIAFGIQSESIFYSVHPEGSRKPDHIVTPGNALAPGEVGLSYVYGHNSSHDPRLPLLIAPMKSGTHLAWRKPFDGTAAVLLISRGRDPFENPPFDLNRRGEILLADGSLLLDPSQPYFHGKPINIRHPEFAD
ncbi:hypothetical protein [Haloferula sp.]|uniref:hypothetical protein n=1 Tax=Haloferula sp. TaxID=2497595 RepID=UPI00329D18BA